MFWKLHLRLVLEIMGTSIVYSKSSERVRPQDGVLTMTDASLADASPADVLFVPGGLGTRALQHDDAGMRARHWREEGTPRSQGPESSWSTDGDHVIKDAWSLLNGWNVVV